MLYQVIKPSSYLSQYVKHYWSMDHCIDQNQDHIQRIVPCGLFELVFYLHDKPVSSVENNLITDYIVVSGQQKGFYDLKVSGKISLFAVYFHPHGLSMFLNIPLNELFDKSIPLRLILKEQINKLEDLLSGSKNVQQRIEIIEQFLFQQITRKEQNYNYSRVRHTVDLINRFKGNIDIDKLVSSACLSRKQFERLFSEIIGTSPKQFLRIIRFQHALAEKSKNRNLSLSELTYICGYYDQAHMINDFKAISGYTPKQYFNTCEPFSDYFN